MKQIDFFHGGDIQDSRYYNVGIYSLEREEALLLASCIQGHFQPRIMPMPQVFISPNVSNSVVDKLSFRAFHKPIDLVSEAENSEQEADFNHLSDIYGVKE